MKVEFSRFVEIKYKTEEGICRQIFNLEHIVRVMDYGDETLIVLMNGEEFWIPKSYVNVGGILFGYPDEEEFEEDQQPKDKSLKD